MTLSSCRSSVGYWAALSCVLALTLANCHALTGQAADGSWPMLAHDAARSGGTTAEIRPPFARKWYRLFPDEGLMAGVQPVAADGSVFVGTLAGVVHAIDAGTGQDRWSFRAGGAVLHTCAAEDGRVYFGCADGKIYAVRDLPWCRADLFYLGKLVACVEADGVWDWQDVRR